MGTRTNIKPLLVYTMTSGLGDLIVMGDLIRKIEMQMSGARCLIVHRDNPHIALWTHDNPSQRFYNIYKPAQLWSLISHLLSAKKEGYTILGLQMAPGSLQGFLFFSFLKKIKTLNYVVDFNLINADIITPPKGNYILDIHLNQIKGLFYIPIPPEVYRLQLPFKMDGTYQLPTTGNTVGIHPWSRRGKYSSFTWPYENWIKVIRHLLITPDTTIVIFGKDKGFKKFEALVKIAIGDDESRVRFIPSTTVQDLLSVIQGTSRLISVNTSVVHIGYALNKPMVILCGPSLDIWIPKGDNIKIVSDEYAFFSGSDKPTDDQNMSTIRRVTVDNVLRAINA